MSLRRQQMVSQLQRKQRLLSPPVTVLTQTCLPLLVPGACIQYHDPTLATTVDPNPHPQVQTLTLLQRNNGPLPLRQVEATLSPSATPRHQPSSASKLHSESSDLAKLARKVRLASTLKRKSNSQQQTTVVDPRTSASSSYVGCRPQSIHFEDSWSKVRTYIASNNETPTTIANKLGVPIQIILELNRDSCKGLTRVRRFVVWIYVYLCCYCNGRPECSFNMTRRFIILDSCCFV